MSRLVPACILMNWSTNKSTWYFKRCIIWSNIYRKITFQELPAFEPVYCSLKINSWIITVKQNILNNFALFWYFKCELYSYFLIRLMNKLPILQTIVDSLVFSFKCVMTNIPVIPKIWNIIMYYQLIQTFMNRLIYSSFQFAFSVDFSLM